MNILMIWKYRVEIIIVVINQQVFKVIHVPENAILIFNYLPVIVHSIANSVFPNFYVHKTLHQRFIQKWVELSYIIHESVFNAQVYLVNTNSFLVGQLVVELC